MCTRIQDGSTSDLWKAAVTGPPVGAVIEFTNRGDNKVNLKLTLSQALITAHSVSGSRDTPTETLTIDYGKIEIELKNRSSAPTGTPDSIWDPATAP